MLIIGRLFVAFSDSHALQGLLTTIALALGVFGLHFDPSAAFVAVSPMMLSIAGTFAAVIARHAATARVQSAIAASPNPSAVVATGAAREAQVARAPQAGYVRGMLLLPLAVLSVSFYTVVVCAEFAGCGANATAIRAAEKQCLAQDLATLTSKVAACAAQASGAGSAIACGAEAVLTSGEAICAIEALGAKAPPLQPKSTP
jgi:hypothetical protein